MSAKIRVLVVDDSAFSRQTIKTILENEPDVEVVGIATDGMDAMSKAIRLRPDLVTLDFEMPEMDGFSFLRWLMKEAPTPVLMVSSNSDAKVVFKAMELGAVDFVSKPTSRASQQLRNIEKDLLEKVRGIKGLNLAVLRKNLKLLEDRITDRTERQAVQTDVGAVAIGSSTGGPSALQVILTELPSDMPCSIVISQHMPAGFTRSLAERLDKLCGLKIKEAEAGESLRRGTAYICPGGQHMSFTRFGDDVQIALQESAFEDKYTPSVDRMMLSAVKVFNQKILGIVLTGMGNDGREGMKEIRSTGGYTVVESEETAVVFGMPQEVIKAKAAETVLPLDMISSEIRRITFGERRR